MAFVGFRYSFVCNTCSFCSSWCIFFEFVDKRKLEIGERIMTKTIIPKHYSPTREEILKALGAVSETEYNKMWRSLDEKTKDINELVQKMHTLEERLEVSEKAHYKTLEQLRIATKVLRGICVWASTGNCVEKAVKKVCEKALKEMEGVK